MRWRRVGPAVIAAMLLVETASCRADRSSDGPATRDDTAPVREDLAPLTKRFPALGEPISARWKSGTMGDPRVPGPSTYWIDAIVRVTPVVADQLAAGTSSAGAPEVVEVLRVELPAGPWVASEQLNRTLSASGFGSQVRLDPATGTVVLRSIGEG